MSTKKRGLGRGLDVLLGMDTDITEAIENGAAELKNLPVKQLQPGKYQPRTGMDPSRLQELADSIRVQGVIQPIVVRSIGHNKFEIIAGERRWRAAQLAELTEVPCVVRELPDQATVAVALIENIQREDLHPMEEAQALQRLIQEFNLTHAQAAEAVGRSRAAVSNLLRLIDMPKAVRELFEARKLDMGHVRALLTLPEARAITLAKQAVELNWSVRDLEDAARQAQAVSGQTKSGSKAKTKSNQNADIARLEQELSEKFATRVNIQHGAQGKGKLLIHYHNLDILDGILERIK